MTDAEKRAFAAGIEAARVLRDAPELMEGWSEDGWSDICAIAEQEEFK